jgi:glucose/arabinose dehydrogenase
MKHIFLFAVLSLFIASTVFAQYGVGGGKVRGIYQQHCASCHGPDLQGSSRTGLLKTDWRWGSSDEDLRRIIAKGLPEEGKIGYEDVLTSEEIRSLVIFIREANQAANKEALLAKTVPDLGVFSSDEHQFELQKVVEHDGIIWGLDFMPDGSMIYTLRRGDLFVYADGQVVGPILNTPEVWERGQGGLMDVAVHPDYEENGWIYLGFSERLSGSDEGMTAIARGRIVDGAWVDHEMIFQSDPKFHMRTHHHFGTRIVFQDGYLFFAIGDRGRQDTAQDTSLPNGKIHRIYDDGRIPEDNPFIGDPEFYPTTWSHGHRNPQGIDIDPRTGKIWSTEHGPRGGDELNLIEPGKNYGWPIITHGMNYNGTPITDKTAQEGLEQPVLHWTPSIAVCGIDFYEGDLFPGWKNQLFVTGLVTEELHRLVIEDDEVVHSEIVMKNQGRIRDVSTGPDGALYVSLNSGSPRVGAIYRIVPAE